jgi:hypothetical protein
MPRYKPLSDLALRGRIGGYTTASRFDGRTMTAAARAAFGQRWYRDIPADLPEAERDRRAEYARKTHYATLGRQSARKRREKREGAAVAAVAALGKTTLPWLSEPLTAGEQVTLAQALARRLNSPMSLATVPDAARRRAAAAVVQDLLASAAADPSGAAAERLAKLAYRGLVAYLAAQDPGAPAVPAHDT